MILKLIVYALFGYGIWYLINMVKKKKKENNTKQEPIFKTNHGMNNKESRFCSVCGASIEKDASFCAACGAPVKKRAVSKKKKYPKKKEI